MPKTIWIDLENTPHVPFFVPIIRDLEAAGMRVLLTARDFAQTKDLAKLAGLNVRVIGGEYGSSTIRKAFGLVGRAGVLAWQMRRERVDLAVGHGSRGLLLAARLLRVSTLTLYDYEGASVRLFNKLSTWVMTPELLTTAELAKFGLPKSKHLTYSGIKEEVYADDFIPSASLSLKSRTGDSALNTSKIIITVRPPSRTAHYRSDNSFRLLDAMLHELAGRQDVQVVLVPRTHSQRRELERDWSNAKNMLILDEPVSGLDLLYHSDLVIGGGGTVNREAAALGVPVVTIFKGPEGAVDRWLIQQGRMIAIESAEEIEPLLHKRQSGNAEPRVSPVRAQIVATILRLAGAA